VISQITKGDHKFELIIVISQIIKIKMSLTYDKGHLFVFVKIYLVFQKLISAII